MNAIFIFLVSLAFANAAINGPACGTRPFSSNIRDRILGGTTAKEGDWGWQVVIRKNIAFICGGILIDESWVLTAQHCFQPLASLNSYAIELGVHDISWREPGVQSRTVSKIFLHSGYSESPVANDIALIKLNAPVIFNNKIIPACLSNGTENFENYETWVTGWGGKSLTGLLQLELQQAKSNLLSDARCETIYGSSIDVHKQLCSVELGQNLGPCVGDSGGPQVAKSSITERYNAIGVISWGYGCGDGGVYTRISYYLPWILQIMNAN